MKLRLVHVHHTARRVRSAQTTLAALLGAIIIRRIVAVHGNVARSWTEMNTVARMRSAVYQRVHLYQEHKVKKLPFVSLKDVYLFVQGLPHRVERI